MKRRKIIFNQPMIPFEEWSPEDSASEIAVQGQTGLADLDENETSEDIRLNYISFGSGSSGNSYYIGCREGGIIIDAGIRAEDIERILNENGVSMKMVKGLLLTHDHSDHVKYAYSLLRKHRHIRLYSTNRVLTGLLRRHSISKRIKEYHNPIFKEIPFTVMDFEITAFEVSHDGSDNMGFDVHYRGHHFVLATDMGSVTPRARFYISQANYLVIESNYDDRMLTFGGYPEHLKARIRAERGHMENESTAEFLNEIFHPGLKYIFLCHLSEENNTPSKAVKVVRESLENAGHTVGTMEETILDRKADVRLMALPRYSPTRWFVFRL